MKVGFCTQFKEEKIKFAQKTGFEMVEINVSPDSPLDPRTVKDDELKRARELLDKYRIKVGSLFHFFNYGAKDETERKTAIESFSRALQMAKILGTEIVAVNGLVIEADLPAKIKYFKKVFTEFAKKAEGKGIRIGLENCPHRLNNLAYSPKMWKIIFNEVPNKSLGLEYDPSHLFWQQIDYIKAIYDFKERIYAFHAKDTEILKENLKEGGILDGLHGGNWWRSRLPGYGEIDWKRIFVALADIGYEGDISIEHEDPVFGGERTNEGLKRGCRFLRQFIF